jgi:hypothetical protein
MAAILAGLITVADLSQLTNPVSVYNVQSDRWAALMHPYVAQAFANLMIAWLVLSGLYLILGFTSAQRADARSYDSLDCHLQAFVACWDVISLRSQLTADTTDAEIARNEINELLRCIVTERQARDPRWILGYGYISLWRKLHRIEEASFEVVPAKQIASEVHRDLLRLQGSHMGRGSEVDRIESELTEACQPPYEGFCSAHTRERARQLRFALNDYRTTLWMRLLLARNRLLASIVFTSFTVYVLLWLAIAAHVAPDAIISLTTFYFVGATIGLFNRLYSDWKARGRGESSDCNLATYELLGVPLLSGVAAVFGVLLTAAISVGPGAAPGGFLSNVLDIGNHPLNLVTAAAFGLTPGLVLDRLTREMSTKEDLRSLEAHEGAPVTVGGDTRRKNAV